MISCWFQNIMDPESEYQLHDGLLELYELSSDYSILEHQDLIMVNTLHPLALHLKDLGLVKILRNCGKAESFFTTKFLFYSFIFLRFQHLKSTLSWTLNHNMLNVVLNLIFLHCRVKCCTYKISYQRNGKHWWNYARSLYKSNIPWRWNKTVINSFLIMSML